MDQIRMVGRNPICSLTVSVDFNDQLLKVIFLEGLAESPQNGGDHVGVNVALLVAIEHIERFSEHCRQKKASKVITINSFVGQQ